MKSKGDVFVGARPVRGRREAADNAARALAASELRYRRLFESAKDGILILDAVGIRVQDGEEFPYLAEDGFPEHFLQTENTLIEHDGNGEICRDDEGNVCLECTCGLVLKGKTDPANSLTTKRC